MQSSKWDFDATTDSDVGDILWPKSSEEFADDFGMGTALVVLCIAFFIAAIWFVSIPSFEKCVAVANVTDRYACYERLRRELLKPPAKRRGYPQELNCY